MYLFYNHNFADGFYTMYPIKAFVFLYLTCILNGETPNSHSNIVQYDLTIALQKHIQFDN